MGPMETILKNIDAELRFLFAAHSAVGLEGAMALYTDVSQDVWRSKQAGFTHWFTAQEIPEAIKQIEIHYNKGELPNSPLLLNPLIHEKLPDGGYKPIGSGIIWCTGFCLGIDALTPEQQRRIQSLGVMASPFHRGENEKAGLKMLALSTQALAPLADGKTVTGCKELYAIMGSEGEAYYPYYLLSGLAYLGKHGSFSHPDFAALGVEKIPDAEAMKNSAIPAQKLVDAAYCWEHYDRHHSLFMKFGIDPAKVEHNLRFYTLCARDIQLFDATGPMRKGADESFEFVVPGYIPRGSVTLIAAAGGTGKSSVAHHLCVLASMDHAPGAKPHWLGQPLNTDLCKGICIYFSGEDGPAIINARGALFDPEGRSNRLMFQRTDFGDGVSFSGFLKRLHKMPDVPIIVIDPARKYLAGDEDDSNVVSEFFEAIEEFAITKKAAMVVVHHLRKGANPQTTRQVLDELRGSQVFIDRPRVVIGMFRDGAHTVVGLAKNNIPPNMGMVMEERVFARNPKNLQLIWLPGPQGVRSTFLPPEQLEELELQSMRAHGLEQEQA